MRCPRAADDFVAIRARMDALRREREETPFGTGPAAIAAAALTFCFKPLWCQSAVLTCTTPPTCLIREYGQEAERVPAESR
jgi:hypothetical protein